MTQRQLFWAILLGLNLLLALSSVAGKEWLLVAANGIGAVVCVYMLAYYGRQGRDGVG